MSSDLSAGLLRRTVQGAAVGLVSADRLSLKRIIAPTAPARKRMLPARSPKDTRSNESSGLHRVARRQPASQSGVLPESEAWACATSARDASRVSQEAELPEASHDQHAAYP